MAKLKKHLAYECNKVYSDTEISALMMLTSNCEDSGDDTATTSLIRNENQMIVHRLILMTIMKIFLLHLAKKN